MRNKYVVLKYLRLSREDGDNAESDSIANQRSLIDSYVKNEMSDKQIETIELVDDGYSGTNMERPGMKKLLILAETRSINCIIVKDFFEICKRLCGGRQIYRKAFSGMGDTLYFD